MVEETITPDQDEAAADAEEPAAEVAPVELEALGPAALARASAPPENLGRVMDVCVSLTARVGRVRKTISDIIDLAPGSIVDLERNAGDPIDLVIGDKLMARGEIVVVDDRYGVRIVEVVQDKGD